MTEENSDSAEIQESVLIEKNKPTLKNSKPGGVILESKSSETSLTRQVEMKRKYLDHIIQVLNQTISYLLTSLTDSSHLIEVSSTNNSSSSSAVSSSSSSPVHITDTATTISK